MTIPKCEPEWQEDVDEDTFLPHEDSPESNQVTDAGMPMRREDDPEWQAIVDIERSLRGEEIGATFTWRPAVRFHEDQALQLRTPSLGAASSDGRGFWYRQFTAPARSTEAGAADESRLIETKVAGVTYEDRQSVVRKLAEGEEVRLCREPKNPHDRNAIRVERLTGEQIGYISRVEAATLAPSLDRQGKLVAAVVTAVLRGYGANSALGVRIRFKAPEAGASQRPALPDFRDSWEDWQ